MWWSLLRSNDMQPKIMCVFIVVRRSSQKKNTSQLSGYSFVNSCPWIPPWIFQHSNSDVHPYFLELLSSLGWPVNVYQHPGWTGHLTTSWREQTEPMSAPEWQIPGGSGGGGAYDGDHHALYWADASAEIAFLVPTNKPKTTPPTSLLPEGGPASGTEGNI